MPLYGDESGHFRSVLEGEDDVVVVAVVSGPENACIRCPSRTVDRRGELDEAKWSDLNDVEKRRFADCLRDSQDSLKCGFAAFSRDALHRMSYSYRFHEEGKFEYNRDVSAMAWCYCELVSQIVPNDQRDTIVFDQFFHRSQSENLKEMLSQRVNDRISVEYDTPHGSKGIQSADCIAGAVSEHRRGGYNWLERLDESTVIDATDPVGAHIQHELSSLGD